MDDSSGDEISDRQINDIVEGWSQGDSFSQSDNVVDMDCSESDSSGRKRKSSELPRYNKVRVIVPNPELNAENDIESSILFSTFNSGLASITLTLLYLGNSLDFLFLSDVSLSEQSISTTSFSGLSPQTSQ